MYVVLMVTMVVVGLCQGGSDPKAAAQVEAGLLQLLGMPRRPRPRSAPTIPKHMTALYEQQKKMDTANIPLIGAGSANTVRSFGHGNWKWIAIFELVIFTQREIFSRTSDNFTYQFISWMTRGQNIYYSNRYW